MLDVINEAQCFDILLKSARYALSIPPKAGPDKFVGDAPQRGMNFCQLLFRLGCGAERSNMVVVRCVVQYPLKKKYDLL
jgi:hypothetical protein